MAIHFQKYQGTGNDFIMVDGFESLDMDSFTERNIAGWCDRRFGIGADGLIILLPSEQSDFQMLYYNADGQRGSMCGNGGRCAYQFAHDLGKLGDRAVFEAADGQHEAFRFSAGVVSLKMADVNEIIHLDSGDWQLNTGSPHFIQYVNQLDKVNIYVEGKAIRNSPSYLQEGINVNFVEFDTDHLKMSTYERGVEDVTYSCGTGVTAAALTAIESGKLHSPVHVSTQGGHLVVTANKVSDGMYKEIWLTGEASFVFKGEINPAKIL